MSDRVWYWWCCLWKRFEVGDLVVMDYDSVESDYYYPSNHEFRRDGDLRDIGVVLAERTQWVCVHWVDTSHYPSALSVWEHRRNLVTLK
jgi:hypothetical protein